MRLAWSSDDGSMAGGRTGMAWIAAALLLAACTAKPTQSASMRDRMNKELAASHSGPGAPLRIVSGAQPRMPQAAIDADIQGDVTVQVVIGKDGRIQGASVIGSPHAILSAAVLDAMLQWQFEPPLLDGVAQEIVARQTFKFRIEQPSEGQ